MKLFLTAANIYFLLLIIAAAIYYFNVIRPVKKEHREKISDDIREGQQWGSNGQAQPKKKWYKFFK